MNKNTTDSFASLYDALSYVSFTSGLHLNETLVLLRTQSFWPSVLNLIPLILGIVGLIFNILALLIFTASKTFRQSSFRCYIYAFVLVNCASILSHSWLYLVFYIIDPMYLCKYIQYLQQSLSTTSLWIMVLLSFERSVTFAQPFRVKKLLKSRTIFLMLLLVTCSCFISHIDEIILVDIKAFRWVNFAYGTCSIKRHAFLAVDRIKILTHSHSFILPFLLNSILDIYICYNICQRRKRLLRTSTLMFLGNKSRRSKISLANEITLTLLCQSMWLLITYFPTHLYYSLISFKLINNHDRDNSTLVFFIRQNLLIYLAFSPTLYVILSPTLRKEIHLHICQSYVQSRTTSSSYISNGNKKFENFFNPHRQRLPYQKTHLTILITRSEQLPRKFHSNQIIIPKKCFKNYKSKSTSYLSTYTNQDEFNQYKKTERSMTLHQ